MLFKVIFSNIEVDICVIWYLLIYIDMLRFDVRNVLLVVYSVNGLVVLLDKDIDNSYIVV